MIVWVIGLAGSGKSTVGRLVYEAWKTESPATVLVDGDEIREIFRHDRGDSPYSVEGRRANSDRISEICAWLDRQGINVVCCILSIFEDARQWNRATYSDYLEVYLSASDESLAARRPIYEKARAGEMSNVVGVDIPFVPPAAPDMRFKTDGEAGLPPEEIAASILDRLEVAR